MIWLQHLKALLYRYEPQLFWLCAAGFIAPLWLMGGIYTYDGPAHLYNARQMWEMLFNHNDWLYGFYELNSGTDNWLVHGMLMLLQAAFGAVLAEKVWFTLYVFLFILGFRRWMLYMQQTALSWWVFLLPFFFNVLLGQYSFALSVALMPFFMLQWQRYISDGKKSALFLAAVYLTLLYLTHVVSFGVAGMAGGLFCLFGFTSGQAKLKQLGQLALIALPGLLMTLVFMSRNANMAESQWLTLSERISHLYNFRALIGYSYTEESGWTRLVALVFAVLLLVALVRNHRYLRESRIWLIVWAVVLVLNLVAPDIAAGGGFIQTRLNILFILFSFVLLASFKRMTIWYKSSIPLMLFITLRIGLIHFQNNQNLVFHRADWEAVALHIPAESTVATFNYSPLWFQHHIQLIIGQDKPVIHTSNYEADNNYFPLRWKQDVDVHAWLTHWADTKSLMPCGSKNLVNEMFLPDYLISYFHDFGQRQGCTKMFDTLLVASYTTQPVYSSEHLKVYKRR